jgi:hypothetical protein
VSGPVHVVEGTHVREEGRLGSRLAKHDGWEAVVPWSRSEFLFYQEM